MRLKNLYQYRFTNLNDPNIYYNPDLQRILQNYRMLFLYLADEYELSAESIVIAPNATTGSITISTFGYDDNEVEVSESIVFTFAGFLPPPNNARPLCP